MKKPEGSLIAFFSRKVKKGGGINLAQGRPGFTPPQRLLEILKKNISDPDLHQYAPGNGDPLLLDALVQKYTGAVTPERKNFLVVQGATEGIFLSFFYLTTLMEKGAGVLSFDPVYESYPKLPAFMDFPFHYYDTPEDFETIYSEFRQRLRANNIKVIFVSSPGNPQGKIWKRRELELLARAAEENGAGIIFDAVYSDLYFGTTPFNPMEMNHPNIFYVNSFSKTFSITGWRIGYIHASPEHMTKIRALHDYTGLCAPYLLQRSIAEFMGEKGEAEDYIRSIRDQCGQNIRYLTKILAAEGFRVPSIEGGYFFWGEIPETYRDGFAFAEELYKKQKVAVVPGINFSPVKKNHIRINCAVDHHIIREGAAGILRFLQI